MGSTYEQEFSLSQQETCKSKLQEFIDAKGGGMAHSAIEPGAEWDSVSAKRKKRCVESAVVAIRAVLETLAPGSEDQLWQEVQLSQLVETHLQLPTKLDAATVAVIESYCSSAGNMLRRRSILSIIVDQHSQKQLLALVPGILMNINKKLDYDCCMHMF